MKGKKTAWYNAERVRTPGSVVLNAWREQNGPERLGRTPLARAAVQTSARGRRMYAGAKVDRLTSDWAPMNTSADAELVTSLRMLRARSRQVCRDNEHAKNALRQIANNVIGAGVGMQGTVKTAGGVLPPSQRSVPNESLRHRVPSEARRLPRLSLRQVTVSPVPGLLTRTLPRLSLR